MKLLYTLFITHFLTSQTIDFYRADLGHKINDLEAEIFENVIELFNKKNSPKLYIKSHKIPFSEVFKTIKSDSNNYICVAQALTITEERQRKYSFSIPYIPVEQMIMTLKSNKSEHWKSSSISYVNYSLEEEAIKHIQPRYTFKGVGFDHFEGKLDALLNGQVNYMIADNVVLLTERNIRVVETIDYLKPSGFGFMYPKYSTLKSKLDPYISYFINSTKFYKLLIKFYGNEVTDYFVKNVKNVKIKKGD